MLIVIVAMFTRSCWRVKTRSDLIPLQQQLQEDPFPYTSEKTGKDIWFPLRWPIPPPFVAMLDQYQDEISRSGPLTLPCSAAAFELVLRRAHEQATVHNKKYVDDDSPSTLSYCCDSSTDTGIFYYYYYFL